MMGRATGGSSFLQLRVRVIGRRPDLRSSRRQADLDSWTADRLGIRCSCRSRVELPTKEHVGDVIISVDGDAVRTPSEFSRQMRSAGEKITLKIVRDKQERDITLDRPSARPARATRISV